MRRAASLILAALLAAPAASAQATVGARLGALYAAPIDPDPGISGRAGLGLVAFAERPVGRVVLGGEVGVLQGGFRQEVAGPDSGQPSTLRARVTVSTFAAAAALPLGRVELFAGPRLDVRLSESGTLDGQTGRLTEYDDAMLGLAAGAGVRAPVGPTTLRVDVRVSRMRVTSARSELHTELRAGLTL